MHLYKYLDKVCERWYHGIKNMKGWDSMKKTLYSLMLNDEVVREVDILAHRLGTNRSALINQILAEYVDDLLCEFRPDTPDEARSKVFLNAVHGGGQGFLKGRDLELAAVFAVNPPLTAQRQHGADMGIRHHADDGYQIRISFGGAFSGRCSRPTDR